MKPSLFRCLIEHRPIILWEEIFLPYTANGSNLLIDSLPRVQLINYDIP